jgi:EAL domain-containing protein (putative c-di-GMP-specific phosphodiesterase class I)
MWRARGEVGEPMKTLATHNEPRAVGCAGCTTAGPGLGFDFSMAFQPIVNVTTRTVFAHEALVRGPAGESAASVLGQVTPENRYRFDQAIRVCAIRTAASLGMNSALSINFMPNAVYKPEHCLRTTLEAAELYGFPPHKIILEVTEGEKVENPAHLKRIIDYYKSCNIMTAIDDFGAGFAGLGLLADFLPDILKIDMCLIRDIDTDRSRRAIVRGVLLVCDDLGIKPIAEGVETAAEVEALRDLGVELFQGYHFARPAFEALADVPALAEAA